MACVLFALLGPERLHSAPKLSIEHTEWPKAVFDWSYVLIASPQEWKALDTLSGEARERFLGIFWKRRDPTPTTPDNEFLVQFEERVDFALTRFPVRAQPEPWDRRGEVYIRFGPPDDIVDSTFDAYYEKWYYFQLNLRFMFAGGAEGQRIIPFHEFSGEVQAVPRYYDDIKRMESRGVLYVPPLGELQLDVALDVYPFRRTDGAYDVYVASAAPAHDLGKRNWRRDLEGFHYVARVVAFDSALGVTWQDSTLVQETRARAERDGLTLHQWSTVLVPGFYVVAAEWDDAQGPRRGVASFDRWLVPYDTGVELDLSPLVIAEAVRDPDGTSSGFVRNGKEIVPMPSHTFEKSQAVAFYHEVYNLRPDTVGQCRYRVEYSLYPEGADERRSLYAGNFESAERATFQAGTLPAGTVSSGTYILEVKTTDLVADVTKIALANFKVD